MAYAALVSLAQTINQILNHDHSPTTLAINQEIIRSIRHHAVVLQSFLEEFPQKANSLEGQIREVANTAEDVIEFLLSAKNPSDCRSMKGVSNSEFELQLQEVAEKLKSTAGDVVDCVKHIRRQVDSSVVSSSSRRSPTSKDLVLGSHEDLFWITMQLTCSSSRLQVLPIVGIGGIGKTTIAKLVYNSSPIMEHFDIRGWVTVSQDYSVGSIALNLLASMKGISAEREVDREISKEVVS